MTIARLECMPRTGLPFTAARLEKGEPVVIGYFGGSITQADGWRNGTFRWFQEQYPRSAFTMIPASVGGTGSDLGAFRMDRDLLPHNPDLVFVEFAVNDSGTAETLISDAMEGIVRKLRRARPACDILFVYTINAGMSADLQNGVLQRAAAVHERVADHYGIPSIHMALEVVRREAEGSLVFTAFGKEKTRLEQEGKLVFCADSCHPLPAGHQLYAEAVLRHLPGLLKAGPAVPLPAPLSTGCLDQAVMADPGSFRLSGDWRALPRSDWPPIAWSADSLPALWVAETPGATAEFTFTGPAFGVFLVVGPACGSIEWQLDDRPAEKADLFDGFCTYYRPSYRILASRLEQGPHRVRIRLLEDQPDKLAILAGCKASMDFPDRFNGTRFYLAAALVNGKMGHL